MLLPPLVQYVIACEKKGTISTCFITLKLRIAAFALHAVLTHACCSRILGPLLQIKTIKKREGPRARRVHSQRGLPVQQGSLQLVVRGARPPVAVAQGRV